MNRDEKGHLQRTMVIEDDSHVIFNVHILASLSRRREGSQRVHNGNGIRK